MQNTPDILKDILARKQEEVRERESSHSLEKLVNEAKELEPARPFFHALLSTIETSGTAVIAEIKKASPDKGIIRKDFDVAAIAKSYESGGATCLSVSTDRDFFQGSDDYLQQAKRACNLPVLRNDFIVDPYQIYESRVLGADCIVLIAAALKDSQLRNLSDIAASLKLDVLIKIHNREELERAHVLRSPLIGINNRDLHSFDTSIDVTLGLLHDVFPDRTIISEGGIHSAEDVRKLKRNGVNAFLVGESLLCADDPGLKLKELFSME